MATSATEIPGTGVGNGHFVKPSIVNVGQTTAKEGGRRRKGIMRVESMYSKSTSNIDCLEKQPLLKPPIAKNNVMQNRRVSDILPHALEQVLECAICLDDIKRPKMLPCQHTFCQVCLQSYDTGTRSTISCPTCRQEAPLPRDGVAGFPNNLHIENILSILRSTNSKIASGQRKVSVNGSSTTTKQVENIIRCSQCQTVIAKSEETCQHCKMVFCAVCLSGHIESLRLQLGGLVEQLNNAKERLQLRTDDFKARCESVLENVNMAAEVRIQAIKNDQEKLTNHVQEILTKHDTSANKLQIQIEESLASVGVTQEFDALALNNDKVGLFLKLHTITSEILSSVSRWGQQRLTFDEDTFQLHDDDDDDTDEPETDSSPLTPEPSPVDVPRRELPSTPDEQSLYYRSKSFSPRVRFGKGVLQRPAGVGLAPWAQELYVAGSDNHVVSVFDLGGKLLRSLGVRNDKNLLCPLGIAFSAEREEVYVTDKWKHCVHVYSRDGTYLRQLGLKGRSPGHFRSPEGVATDPSGLLYVCDTCNDRVQVIEHDGAFVREIGIVSEMNLPDGRRYLKTEFNQPTGVAISADGTRIFVCDSGNRRIKVFTNTGERICCFGSAGDQRGQLKSPECIAVDRFGFIFVGDAGNRRVQIFRPNGNFVRAFGSRGSAAGKFSWISGITITPQQDIIVTDFKNHCVQLF